jgi:hypothetical protein
LFQWFFSINSVTYTVALENFKYAAFRSYAAVIPPLFHISVDFGVEISTLTSGEADSLTKGVLFRTTPGGGK